MRVRTKKTMLIFGAFLILCGIVPLFYGVVNAGALILLLIGGFLAGLPFVWDKLGRGLQITVKAGLTALFAVILLTSAVMARQAWFHHAPEGSNLPVIVLGGRVYEDGPSLMVAYRLNAAAAYLQENPEAVCIVSGGQGADEPAAESAIMAQYLTGRHGIDSERIIEENQSTSTRENIQYSKAYLDGDEVVIATSDFHQLRASILAGKEGLYAYSVPAFTPPGLMPAYWLRDLFGVFATLIFH